MKNLNPPEDIVGIGPAVRLGTAASRIDGPLKVCGAAEYPGDFRLPDLAYAVLVRSPMARGTISAIDDGITRALPGVLDVLTHANVGNQVRHVAHVMAGGWANSTHRPLSSPDVHYGGQIVALVVGETLDAAAFGAQQLSISYETLTAQSSLEFPDVTSIPLSQIREGFEDRRAGDIDLGFRLAAATIRQVYSTPVQHHNPIELPTTTCVWDGNSLTVYEPTRFVGAARAGLAAQLGLDPANVRVVARFIGGHFGSKLALSQHTALCALAAKRVNRPVHLSVSRHDAYTIANHRTETRHHIGLGASNDGRLTALSHVAEVATSRFDDFAMEGTDVSAALYACPNIYAEERVARVDRNTPGPMRAPPEVPYLFALESALDELAHSLSIDPVDLRRRNDTLVDPVTGHPFTTRPLMRCFEQGAAAFGWEKRSAMPRSMLRGGWWVGYGCAAAVRPVKISPVVVRLTIDVDGGALIETAHHEIGNGLYTLLAMTVSDRLGIPLDRIAVRLGDTDLPPAGISGGSSTTTSLVNALSQACERIGKHGIARSVEVEFVPEGAGGDAIEQLRAGHMKLASPPVGKLSWAYGAHFIALRVDAATGEVRIDRHVGAFAAGRILNPMTARSQLLGGMIWGQSSALFEKTEIDPRTGAYLNDDLAEYLVPTFADIGRLEAIIVEDEDALVNAEGVKGLGEIGIIGVNAAVANAVFNATGRRVRDLPIRLEALL